MGQLFSKGQNLLSPSGTEYKIEEFLGGGVKGEVYRISFGDKDWALKWCFTSEATDAQKKSLESLALTESPTEKFLWPLEVITTTNITGFGYIMPLRPKNYKNMVDLMTGRIDPSFHALTTAGFYLADSFFHLHQKNLTFIDLNFGEFFLNPENGDIIVDDIEDFAYFLSSKTARYQGTPRFIAPEIVRGEAVPSTETDRFSLAVLLFYIFFRSHPLEGKKSEEMPLDHSSMNHLYGVNPVFIYDPHNSSNRPDPNFHQNALIYWRIYPQFFKDLFMRAFTEGLNDLSSRISESEWRSAFLKLRDSIIYCQKCGCENFYDHDAIENDGGATLKCWNCSTEIQLPMRLKIGSLIVMLNHNAKIFPYHLDPLFYDLSKPIAEISQHPTNPRLWGLKNLSNRNWQVSRKDGTNIEIPPGKNVTIGHGIQINFGNCTGKILKNNIDPPNTAYMREKYELQYLLSQAPVDYKRMYALIEEEIKKILPPDWEIIFKIKQESILKPSNELKFYDYEWKIIPDRCGDKGFGGVQNYYLLQISFDCDCFIFYHDNSDAGPLTVGSMVQKSHIIPFNYLNIAPFSEIIKHLIESTKPNMYGLS